MTDTKIADWAKQRAVDFANKDHVIQTWGVSDVDNYSTLAAFAKYIEQHEEKPVDPLLIEAREIAALMVRVLTGDGNVSLDYLEGVYDQDTEIIAILDNLREIQKGGAA